MSIARNLAVDLRPKSFDEIIGSIAIVKQIRSQLNSGCIPTAYLFSGPTGCGKTTLARCIVTALNGEATERNAADDTGVDAARELGEQAQHRPLMGDYKVIILDEAHQLTKQAQNALLKHVEDAPSSTVWIFCTTEPSKLLPTLRGRCLSFALGGLAYTETKQLVARAIKHLGKRWEPSTEAFVNILTQEAITAPRAILGAVERFIGGMEPLAAVYSSADSPSAFQIAQAVAKKDWIGVSTLLAGAQNDEAITIRIVLVNYLKSMLLKPINSNSPFAAGAIKRLTENIPAIEVFGLSNLSAILYEVCNPRN